MVITRSKCIVDGREIVAIDKIAVFEKLDLERDGFVGKAIKEDIVPSKLERI